MSAKKVFHSVSSVMNVNGVIQTLKYEYELQVSKTTTSGYVLIQNGNDIKKTTFENENNKNVVKKLRELKVVIDPTLNF